MSGGPFRCIRCLHYDSYNHVRQKSLMWGYAAISPVAFFASLPVVEEWGMMGLCLLCAVYL